MAALGLLCCPWAFSDSGEWGGAVCCGAWASHCAGFSCFRAQALGAWASEATAYGLRSCGPWTFTAHGMWNLPRPGIRHMSPALAGGPLFITPPGKSPTFKNKQIGLFHRKTALCTLRPLYC